MTTTSQMLVVEYVRETLHDNECNNINLHHMFIFCMHRSKSSHGYIFINIFIMFIIDEKQLLCINKTMVYVVCSKYEM